jgi:ABC-type Fe3+ transport system permease subunit
MNAASRASVVDDTTRSAAGIRPGQTVRRRSRRRKERLLAAGLLAPSMLIFAVFVFYPFARNIYLSLYTTPPFPNMPSRFVGLSQYGQVLGSHNFLNSLWVTALFVVLTVPAGLLLGLLLAPPRSPHRSRSPRSSSSRCSIRRWGSSPTGSGNRISSPFSTIPRGRS